MTCFFCSAFRSRIRLYDWCASRFEPLWRSGFVPISSCGIVESDQAHRILIEIYFSVNLNWPSNKAEALPNDGNCNSADVGTSDQMSRTAYRKQGDPRAVRVYTVCDESRYLIVRNVPALGCIDELVKLFGLYGPIEEYRLLDEEECEPFTDVYWIQFVHIGNARFAKRKLDEYKFLGNLLQVTYAPEYESLLDTKDKLEERRRTVLNRISSSSKQRGSKQHVVNSSVESDPLLEPFAIPGRAQQYPKFPLQQITSEREGIDDGKSESSQCGNKSSIHGTPSKQYFSSPSMNATVQSIREKLDRISSVPVPIQSNTSSQQLVDEKESHGNSEIAPTVKKPRHDNRRRI